jgi:hypothetical protein
MLYRISLTLCLRLASWSALDRPILVGAERFGVGTSSNLTDRVEASEPQSSDGTQLHWSDTVTKEHSMLSIRLQYQAHDGCTESDSSELDEGGDQILEPVGQSLLASHEILDFRQRNQNDRCVVTR